jgi:hypothetical protein
MTPQVDLDVIGAEALIAMPSKPGYKPIPSWPTGTMAQTSIFGKILKQTDIGKNICRTIE